MSRVIQRAIEIDRKYSVFNKVAKKIDYQGSGRLSGIAISVKDNICTKNLETTAGSKMKPARA